jgi:uncharacterized protein
VVQGRNTSIATGLCKLVGLALAFFLTALLYASVGFGGGSTYTALLTLAGTDYKILPAISLVCNIIVVSGGTFRYVRAGELKWRRVIPIVAVSAPMAWLGGLTPIKQDVFNLILAISLLAAGLLLLFQREWPQFELGARDKSGAIDIFAGGASGYLAGLVGIGGGIFLAPILHFTRWGTSREIAATASFFILVNSVSGLAGQAMKLNASGGMTSILPYWPLALAVLIGGQIGSFASLKLLSQRNVRRATAALILFVAGQLLWKTLG